MNRSILLLTGRILITLILLLGVLALTAVLIYKPITPTSEAIVGSAISALLILLGFSVHGIFAPGAQVADSPVPTGADLLLAKATALRTLFPNEPGPTAPKAS